MIEIEALKLPPASSKDAAGGGDVEKECLDACHRILTALRKDDAQALDDALDLYFDARERREAAAGAPDEEE